MIFPDGADGVDGQEGRVLFVIAGVEWEVGEPLGCIEPFIEEVGETTLQGVQLCGGNCLSRSVLTTVDTSYELSFDYRWLTTVGTLQARVGGQLMISRQAPASVSGQFEFARVLVTDPSIINGFFQELELCLVPAGPAMVQVANVIFRPAPSTNESPEITVRAVSGQTSVGFSWSSLSGKSYQLQMRSSLTGGSWTNLGPLLNGTGGALTTTAPIVAGQPEGYFRVVISDTP
jgi:hypothetical protein